MCRAEKAAKRQCSDVTLTQNDSVFAIRKQSNQKYHPLNLLRLSLAQVAEVGHIKGGKATVQPTMSLGHYARACHSKQVNFQSGYPPPNPSQRLPRSLVGNNVDQPLVDMSTIKQMSTTDPAPTITIKLFSLNGSYHTDVLPDSGADISAPGELFLWLLNDHVQTFSLLRSFHTQLMGKDVSTRLPTCHIQSGSKQYTDNVNIYPNIPGTILSWKVTKALAILPNIIHSRSHPQPLPHLS